MLGRCRPRNVAIFTAMPLRLPQRPRHLPLYRLAASTSSNKRLHRSRSLKALRHQRQPEPHMHTTQILTLLLACPVPSTSLSPRALLPAMLEPAPPRPSSLRPAGPPPSWLPSSPLSPLTTNSSQAIGTGQSARGAQRHTRGRQPREIGVRRALRGTLTAGRVRCAWSSPGTDRPACGRVRRPPARPGIGVGPSTPAPGTVSQKQWQLPATPSARSAKPPPPASPPGNALPPQPVRGRPWERRRCAPTVRTLQTDRPNRTDARPLYVRGHHNMTVYSATR